MLDWESEDDEDEDDGCEDLTDVLDTVKGLMEARWGRRTDMAPSSPVRDEGGEGKEEVATERKVQLCMGGPLVKRRRRCSFPCIG
jgi:hypothetical protein